MPRPPVRDVEFASLNHGVLDFVEVHCVGRMLTMEPRSLTRATGVGVFADVVNQDDNQVKLTLEFPEVRKERGDLSGVVLIDSVQLINFG